MAPKMMPKNTPNTISRNTEGWANSIWNPRIIASIKKPLKKLFAYTKQFPEKTRGNRVGFFRKKRRFQDYPENRRVLIR
jgi:hypothetical protein